jgi:hypothetical protein
VLRVALADDEDDDGARDDPVEHSFFHDLATRPALTSDVMSGSSENSTTSALRPRSRTRLLARGAVALLERGSLPRRRVLKRGDQLGVRVARGGVRHEADRPSGLAADASFEVTLAIAAATRTARTTPIVLIRTIRPPYLSIIFTVYVGNIDKAV